MTTPMMKETMPCMIRVKIIVTVVKSATTNAPIAVQETTIVVPLPITIHRRLRFVTRPARVDDDPITKWNAFNEFNATNANYKVWV